MNLTHEQYPDIIENCDILLGRLAGYTQTDDTPEGRTIAQLKWLRERAEAKTLPLPVPEPYTATLGRVYAEGHLSRLASSPEAYREEVRIHAYRLLKLVKGCLLLKPDYYPYTIRHIDALIRRLRQPSRPLSVHEQGSIGELELIKTRLQNREIGPPLMRWEGYPNFRKVSSMAGNSIDDMPGGKALCDAVAQMIFEGVRPLSWETPLLADKASEPMLTIGLNQ
ncbi:MAG: hypothetical protein JJU06_04780 [Ectothiorhodospiraceae bacterium]|nr:hypothetical protein [Ectothiorhodospiraceae bacterium]MCH8502965.1 hypothetical protein [Ectothiorhodospiraceae bacterium]